VASKNLKNKSTSVKAKKKKKKLTFTTGVVNIHSTANNTIISVADENGNIIA
jgi:ribosomal protein S11